MLKGFSVTTTAEPETEEEFEEEEIPSSTAASTTTTTTAKPERRFSLQNVNGGMMALAAMFPATALALPMLVGRKRRDAEDDMTTTTDGDVFVRDFTVRHEKELVQKDIAPTSCRQLVDDESNKHLILCPGLRSRSLNMIVLEDSSTSALGDEEHTT